MADSNNVFILFEEIKTALNGIKSKLEELPNVASQQHRIGNDKLDLSPIKETVTETAKAQSEEIKGLLEKQWKAFSQLSTLILHQLDAIKKSQEEQGELCGYRNRRNYQGGSVCRLYALQRLYLCDMRTFAEDGGLPVCHKDVPGTSGRCTSHTNSGQSQICGNQQ